MDKDVKSLWIRALESGEYDKADYYLRVGDSFCALGVLCDLYNKQTGISWYYFGGPKIKRKKHARVYEDRVYSFLGSIKILHPLVREWADISLTEIADIAKRNDELGRTFRQIASYIQRSL